MNLGESIVTMATGEEYDAQSTMLQLVGVNKKTADMISGGMDAASNIALITVGTIATGGAYSSYLATASTTTPMFGATVFANAGAAVTEILGAVNVAKIGLTFNAALTTIGAVATVDSFVDTSQKVAYCNKNVCTAEQYRAIGAWTVNWTVGAVGTVAGVVGTAKSMRELNQLSAEVTPADDLPMQLHHFATNKSSTYTPEMSEIADKFGLDLDGDWNKELLPHLGRHPNAYHEFVLEGMRDAAKNAGGDQATFLRLFNQNVKQPVIDNPLLLREAGW